MQPRRFDVVCGLVWLGIYVCTLAATVSVRDAGEFATASFVLGVAHETGYPIVTLLGKLFALVPVGEVAFRVGLASATMTALGIAVIGGWLRRRLETEIAPLLALIVGAIASSLVGGAALIWRWAIAPEVYGATLLCAALGLVLLDAAARGDERAGRRLGLIAGLALGLHAELRLLIGVPALVLALAMLRRGARWPLMFPTATALGAAVIGYLPIRAAASAYVDWAHPATLARLIAHLQARRIRAAFTDNMLRFDSDSLLATAHTIATQLLDSVGVAALVLAAVGLVMALHRQRRWLGWIVAWLAIDLVYVVLINPMGLRDLQDGQLLVVAVAVLAAAALGILASRVGRGGVAVALVLGLATLVEPMCARFDLKTVGAEADADAWTADAVLALPPRALALVTSDDVAGGLLYQQGVLGRRPDVTTLVRQQIFDGEMVAQRIAYGGNEVRFFGAKMSLDERTQRERDLLERSVVFELSRRTIAWEPASDSPPSVGQLVPGAPLWFLRTANSSANRMPALVPLAAAVVQRFDDTRDPLTRTLPASWFGQLGRLGLAAGDETIAQVAFAEAARYTPDDATANTNLAVLDAIRGDFVQAAERVERVLAADPSRLVARLNAGKYRLRLGDLERARQHFARASKLAPLDPQPEVWLARIAIKQHAREAALQHLEAATRRNGSDPEVKKVQADFRDAWPLP